MDKQLDKVGLDKARLNGDRIDLSKILLGAVPCQSNRNLSRFQCSLNLGEVLGKIWAGVMALTVRHHTRIDMGSRSSRV